MSDYMTAYLTIGPVAVAWGAIGGMLSAVWEPAIWLTLPAALWLVSFVVGIAILLPVVFLKEYLALRR